MAHQDAKKSIHDLSPLEKLNIACDLEAKALITSERRTFIPFPFKLSSLYLLTKQDRVLNSSTSLELVMGLHNNHEYLQWKLHSTFPLVDIE